MSGAQGHVDATCDSPNGAKNHAALGQFHTGYNPYAPPMAYNMIQANMSRARYHTLGPTFSDEEDGDDSDFIRERMRALGLSDKDVYGNSIHSHVPCPADGHPQLHHTPLPPSHYAETAELYSQPPRNGGPQADPGYRRYGQGDPASSRSFCPYPEIASPMQNDRQVQSSDLFRQMQKQAEARASARVQLEQMRVQAEMRQQRLQSAAAQPQARHEHSEDEQDDEEELMRRLQAVREAKLRKQMEMAALADAGGPTGMSSTRGPSISGSDLSSPTFSSNDSMASPEIVPPSIPPPSAAANDCHSAPAHVHTLPTLSDLIARRAAAMPVADPPRPSLDQANLRIDVTQADGRRKARAGLSALGHGRPSRPQQEVVTPPEPTITSTPSIRTSSQPISPVDLAGLRASLAVVVSAQRRIATQPPFTGTKLEMADVGKRAVSQSAVTVTRSIGHKSSQQGRFDETEDSTWGVRRQPVGPPGEEQMIKMNFGAMKRRHATAALGKLDKRVQSRSTIPAGTTAATDSANNEK